jgi:Tol biopolymer transport system component
MPKKFALLAAIGIVLLLSPVAFSQPVFDTPVNLGPKINTSAYEADPFLTADGKKLFFVRDLGIWWAEWTDTGWTNSQIIGPQINVGGWFKQSPSVSPDGQKLYYVDAARGGYNWDIWVSTWDSSVNDWGTPLNLGWPVNTPGEEFSARIGPDGQHLYFTCISDPDSLFPGGRCGTYVSEWDGTNWSVPVDIGVNNCTDGYPSITIDGKWFYFQRYVSDGLSSFVAEQTDSTWTIPVDLRTQIGERSASPFITPSGDSLFFRSGGALGGFGGSDIFIMIRISTVVDDEGKKNLPTVCDLRQNYPNPFNSQTIIPFVVSATARESAELVIFNLLGQPIRHLVNNEMAVGTRIIEWDGTDDHGKEVSSGVYFIRLKVGNESVVKKATFLK